MPIQKVEFYEGAALYRLVRSLGEVRVRMADGMVVLDERLRIYIKYSTKTRSPWGFTFSSEERRTLASVDEPVRLVIGLVCGSDGVVALEHQDYLDVTGDNDVQVAISCARGYDEHYTINGPMCELPRKIAPSAWSRLVTTKR